MVRFNLNAEEVAFIQAVRSLPAIQREGMMNTARSLATPVRHAYKPVDPSPSGTVFPLSSRSR